VGFARGFQISRDEGLQALFESRRVTDSVSVIDVIAIVIDGGDVEGAPPGHFVNGGVVHVRGVLDGIGAGAHGVACAIGTVGMDGDFLAELMRCIDCGFHLFIRVGLEAGDIVIGAG